MGAFVQRVLCLRGFCPGVYVLEPIDADLNTDSYNQFLDFREA